MLLFGGTLILYHSHATPEMSYWQFIYCIKTNCLSVFGRPLGPGLCHRKSVRPSVRPSVTLVDCGQTA